RPLLDGALRRPPPTAPALGPAREESSGRELRQGAPDDQRAPRRPERPPTRPLLPALGRPLGSRPRPEGPPRARRRSPRAPTLSAASHERARPLRRRVALHARDPASRVADAARVRVAPPDRRGDACRARRPPGSARGHGADQDSPRYRARAARSLGARRLVRHHARRRGGARQAENRALISLLRSPGAD